MVIPTYFTLTLIVKKNPRENAECKFAVGPIFPSDYFSGFDASLCKMVDGSRGINKKGRHSEWRHVAKRHLFASIVIIKDVSSE